ncbi:MAG TPA: hypothetical protein PLK52_02020 [Usitatibacteraceae bacterium]|jgi:hypothetical protein|nr:hypothetical protein [Usitatibacteraceae bacterium]HQY46103.1 hypothetical protein [Usitatibacteraceae bacterium]HRA22301.1 hypothetical protein [Usitatibacteraceae bacterium]
MSETGTANVPPKDELDATQTANVGGGIGDLSNAGSTSVLADAYEWLVNATSEAIERIAGSSK